MWRSTIPPSAGTCYTMIIPLHPEYIESLMRKKLYPKISMQRFVNYKAFTCFFPTWETFGSFAGKRMKKCRYHFWKYMSDFFQFRLWNDHPSSPPWMYTKPSHREADIIYLICLMCQHTSCWVVAAQFFNNLLNNTSCWVVLLNFLTIYSIVCYLSLFWRKCPQTPFVVYRDMSSEKLIFCFRFYLH